MKFGCCSNMLARGPGQTGIEIIEDLRALGFDYVELPLAQVAALSPADFDELCRRLQRHALPCPTCNNFFPTSMRLTGPDADLAGAMAYAGTALERAARLGVELVVFGSGPAKMVPAGFPESAAWRQLVELLTMISPLAKRHAITVAIEPLRRQECNIVNSAAEGLALARTVDSEQIKLLIDFYHLDAENEDSRIVAAAGDMLRHVHIARPTGRSFPSAGDAPIFRRFFAALNAASYDGRISIEAYSDDFRSDAAGALELLHGAFPKN